MSDELSKVTADKYQQEKKWWTSHEIAEVLEVSPSTVRKWLRMGLMLYRYLPSTGERQPPTRRIPHYEFKRFLRKYHLELPHECDITWVLPPDTGVPPIVDSEPGRIDEIFETLEDMVLRVINICSLSQEDRIRMRQAKLYQVLSTLREAVEGKS